MYDDIAASYNELHGQEQQRKLKKLLMMRPVSEQESLIDVGCGTAHLREFICSLQYLGVDPSKQLLARAPVGTKVVCASGECIPVTDESFDVGLSLTALHNYENPILGVDELLRVVKDRLYVGVLRRSMHHDAILEYFQNKCKIEFASSDQHDSLFVAYKRRT